MPGFQPDSSELNEESIEKERKKIFAFYRNAFIAQTAVYLLVGMTSRSYIVPFLQNRAVQTLFVIMLAGQVTASFLHWKIAPVSSLFRAACYFLSVVFCFITAIMYPLLGPAVIIIIQALVPISG